MARTAPVFLAGVLLGGTLGAVGVGWLGSAASSPPGERSRDAGHESADDAPAAILVGSGSKAPAAHSPPAPDAGTKPSPRAAGQANSGRDLASRIALAEALIEQGRAADALLEIEAALKSGMSAEALNEAISRLPAAELESLLTAHAGELRLGSVVSWLLHAHAIDSAFGEVERAHGGGAPIDEGVWRAMLDGAPDRAFTLIKEWGLAMNPGLGLPIANALEAAGRPLEALDHMRTAAARRTLEPEEIDWLGERDPHAALDAARTRVSSRPESAAALLQEARLLAKDGNRAGAFAAYEKALRLGADIEGVVDEVLLLDPHRALALFRELFASHASPHGTLALAMAFLIAGDVEDAARQMIAYAGSANDDGYLANAALLAPQAVLPLLVARVPKVETAVNPWDLELYGKALLAAGQRDEALRAFSRAYDLTAGVDQAGVIEGMLEADAVKALVVVETRILGETALDTQRIAAYGRAGRKADAVAAFERHVAAVDGRSEALDAWVALGFSDPERAIAHLRALVAQIEAQGDHPLDEWRALGRVLGAAGRASDARAAYDRALEGNLNLDWEIERARLR